MRKFLKLALKAILYFLSFAAVSVLLVWIDHKAGTPVAWLAGTMLGAVILSFLEPVRAGVEP